MEFKRLGLFKFKDSNRAIAEKTQKGEGRGYISENEILKDICPKFTFF